MSNFMGVGIFWIGLNRADLGCWRLTLNVGFCCIARNYNSNRHFVWFYVLTEGCL